ncbi:MAG TPA: selenocysteine-specific translation elongation factor [Nocardioidaceae bacterium]|nr:selenocysteine-specific translation elongation factor [Nocardioidaceae bacterium]
MQVIATAGHVDHGKSTLVQALTGADPDRLAEEHRRGLSIELGYCWTHWTGVGDCAFVDVPGHERFVPTMLAGVGPVPAVLFVVAADDPWMPQSAEHLAALDALGVRHGVVAVTRSDLADPTAAADAARTHLGRSSLAGAEIVPVSARTGVGMDELRAALAAMLGRVPAPDPEADVRLWVDRSFVVQGAGTVVTGTLPAGTVRVGDALTLGDVTIPVRGVQTLGRDVESAAGVARVAIKLGGRRADDVHRGSVLLTPEAWHRTDVVDVRLAAGEVLPAEVTMHIGSAHSACHVRPLDDSYARLRLVQHLPLRPGDRALLRDPGSARIWGIEVVDPAPPPLRRRRAAQHRAAALHASADHPGLAGELRRRGLVETSLLRRLGIDLAAADELAVGADGWLLDRGQVPDLAEQLRRLVTEHHRTRPLDRGMSVSAVARALELPTAELVPPLVPRGMRLEAGRVGPDQPAALPADVERAVVQLEGDLREAPFRAPDADRLADLGLDAAATAAAARAGRLLRVSPAVILLPGADEVAAERLAALPQPFATSEARRVLDTTRRVVIPLLELLDRTGVTRRLPDDRREIVAP